MRTETPGCGGAEATDHVGQRVHGQGGEGDDVDVPGPDLGHLLGGGPGGRRRPQHLAGRSDERLTRRGEGDPPPQAVEERHPEVALQGGDGLGQRRLGDPHLVGGGGEAPGVDHGQRVLDLTHLHTDNLSYGSITNYFALWIVVGTLDP